MSAAIESGKVGRWAGGSDSLLTCSLSHLLTCFRSTVFAFCLLTLTPAYARINVVSLPDRDTVQLTIYNSVDLTLVKETRHLTFKKGLNKLEFSWANTLIDPTSVEFKALTHADEVEVMDASFPPRAPNTLEWRINSEFAGEVVVEVRYFTSGISWSADYVGEAGVPGARPSSRCGRADRVRWRAHRAGAIADRG